MLRSFMAIALASFLSISCGSDPPSGPTFTVVTWNAGLGPGMVPLSTPRAPHAATAAAALDADVLCLQEVWLAADEDRFHVAMPDRYVYSLDTTGVRPVPEDRCEAASVEGVLACMRASCASVPDEEASLCGLEHCRDPLVALYLSAPHCLHCLASSAGHGIDETRDICLGAGAGRIQNGRNGIILASRWPLENPEAAVLPAGGANRAVLFARVRPDGKTPVEIACTHLSANQDIPPSHSPNADWLSEKISQLESIADTLTARGGGGPQLLVGDMNFGRAAAGINDSSRPAWDRAMALGFSSPAANTQPPFCSSCGDNTLHGPGGGSLIDHVMLRDASGVLVPVQVRRHLDSPATITDHGGAPVTTHLSDHYAVGVTFRVRDDP